LNKNNDSDSVFTPKKFVNQFLSSKKISMEKTGISSIVVLSWAAGPIHWFAQKTNAQRIHDWIFSSTYPVYKAKINNTDVTFIQVGIGAPATVSSMEEMIACGAKTFIGMGWAGSLRKDIPIGTALLPVESVVEEGTSPHYIKDSSLIRPDKDLAIIIKKSASKLDLEVIPSIQWTTDAPYRELKSKIKMYSEKGVSGVDMETSAMYALGIFRHVSVCNLLVVSDELWGEWRPGFFSHGLKEVFTKTQEAVLTALQDLTSS